MTDEKTPKNTDQIRLNKDFVIAFNPETSNIKSVQLDDNDDEDEYDGLDIINTDLDGKYRIIKRLGGGGMGSVFLAEHKVLGKKVAIKVLRPEFSRRKKIVARFLTEAKATSRIKHENIIDVSDFGETENNVVYIVMEYLEGVELSDYISKKEVMTWKEVFPIISQICRGLRSAHQNNIIHRDIKPSNIFLIKFGDIENFVKIIDFGIAKINDITDQKTKTGVIMGTPDYMSPEQAMGGKPTFQSDIYSIGVMMYEMLTGELPFIADSFMGLLSMHMNDDPVPPSKKADITPEVESIVLKAMAKKPEERFQNMDEMLIAIENLNPEGKGEKVKVPLSKTKIKKRKQVFIMLFFIIFLISIFAIWMLLNKNTSNDNINFENQSQNTHIKQKQIKTSQNKPQKKLKKTTQQVKPKIQQLKTTKLTIAVNAKQAKAYLEKGQIKILNGTKIIVLQKGSFIGDLPIKNYPIIKTDNSFKIRIKAPKYKDLILELTADENINIDKNMIKIRKKLKTKKTKINKVNPNSELISPIEIQ